MSIKIQRFIFTVTTVLLVMMTFNFSTQNSASSTKQSKGLIAHFIEAPLFDDVSYTVKANIIKKSDTAVRKTAHFTEFALLGASIFLMLRAWSLKSGKKIYIITLIALILGAMSDEIRQVFSSGRSPMLFDILIDFSGGLFASTIVYAICKKINNKS